jgi:hypothetical protein
LISCSILINSAGYGGACFSGNCRSGTLLETAVVRQFSKLCYQSLTFHSQAWYTQNLQISIPVSVVVGIVCLIIIWAIFTGLRRFLTKRQSTRVAKETSTPIPSTAAPQRLPSWAPPPARSNSNIVPAGPFMVPEQRLQRNGTGSTSRGGAENREIGRRSIVQRGLDTINTWKGKVPALPNRSGGPGGYVYLTANKVLHCADYFRSGQAPFPIAPGYARSRTADRSDRSDRSQWVDETEYNGPRG